jgi:hypothetical protein
VCRIRARECRFERNTAWACGGAIEGAFQGGCLLDLEHCVFLHNGCTSAGPGPGAVTRGGAIEVGGDNDIFRANLCTFTGNYVVLIDSINIPEGSAINSWAVSSNIMNCIISDNTGAPAVSGRGSAVAYCDFFGNPSGNVSHYHAPFGFAVLDTVNANGDSCDQYYNIFLNPRFDAMSVPPVHLTDASPCIDAGDPAFGDPDHTTADMGAYYFDQTRPPPPDGVESETALPRSLALSAYPNPFNPSTTISFEIAEPGWVTLTIYDLLGRQVARVANERMAAGSYSSLWIADGLPSGSYWLKLKAGNRYDVRKILLLR